MKQSYVALGTSALLAACSSVPVIDNSPRAPAVVRIQDVDLQGGLGYFAYRGEQITWTRGAQRRIQQDVKFTESALGAFGAGAERAYLFDLEAGSLQQVDYDSRTFHSCDALGCYEYSATTRTVDPQPPLYGGEQCRLSIDSSTLTLTPAAETASARATFRTVDMDWTVSFTDGQNRSGQSRLAGRLQLAAKIDERAWSEEQAFERRYAEQNDLQWPQALHALVPWVPMSLMQTHWLAPMQAGERMRALAISAPPLPAPVMSGELTWSVSGAACGVALPAWRRNEPAGTANKRAETSSQDQPEAAGDGIDSFEDFMVAMAYELGGGGDQNDTSGSPNTAEPIESIAAQRLPHQRRLFRYQWTLRSLTWGEISENQLRVPDNFSRGTRF